MCSFLPVITIKMTDHKGGKVCMLYCCRTILYECSGQVHKSLDDGGLQGVLLFCLWLETWPEWLCGSLYAAKFSIDKFTQKWTFSHCSIPCQWKVGWNLAAYKTFLELHGSSGVIQSLQKPEDPKKFWWDIIIYPLMHQHQTKCAVTLLALAATVKIPALR